MIRALAIACLGLLALVTHARGASPGNECTVPVSLLESDASLRLTSYRLQRKQPIRIVAIGGGSTAGTAAGPRDQAFPQRLQVALGARYPEIEIVVINKGIPRQSTRQMVDRFASDVLAEAPTLVIWEIGTNDAVRGIDIDEFGRAIQAGIDTLRARTIDIILMDMQFSRSMAALINYPLYLAALHRTADLDDIFVFRRFEIMKYWSETGVFDFENVAREQRQTMAARVYDCIARRLAEAIERAAASPPAR